MTPTLLVADDSLTIQRLVELTLASASFRVVCVGDGHQAIARIEAEHPDVVLADIRLPGRSGYEVAAHVKQNSHVAHIPVLLLKGAFDSLDDARVEACRCDGVISKPFEPERLITRIREALAVRSVAAAEAPAPTARAAEGRFQGMSLPRDQAIDVLLGYSPADADVMDQSLVSLDDYFDRLDAAFVLLSSSSAPSSSAATTLGQTDTAYAGARRVVSQLAPDPLESALITSFRERTRSAPFVPSRLTKQDFQASEMSPATGPGATPTTEPSVTSSTDVPSGASNDLVDEMTRLVSERLAPHLRQLLVETLPLLKDRLQQ